MSSLQDKLHRQLQNTVDNTYTACRANILQINKQINSVIVESKTILINNKEFSFKEKFTVKILQADIMQFPYYVGDEVFVVFTDYNQQNPSTAINKDETNKHLAGNGFIIGLAGAYNFEIKDVILQSRKNENIIIKSANKINIKNKSVVLKKKFDDMYNTINTLKTNVGNLSSAISTNTVAITAVGSTSVATFPNLQTAIQNITQSLDNLNNTLKIIKDDLLTDKDDNESDNT